jgi:hypothetical protein
MITSPTKAILALNSRYIFLNIQKFRKSMQVFLKAKLEVQSRHYGELISKLCWHLGQQQSFAAP